MSESSSHGGGSVSISVRRSLMWSYGAQVSAMTASFVGTVIVSRILTPYDMGLYAIALAISGILGVLTSFGVQSYVVREHVLTREVVRAAFTVNAILNLAVFLLLIAIGWIAAGFSSDTRIRQILHLMSLVPVLSCISFVPLALFTREGNFKIISIVGFTRGIIIPLTNIALVVSGGSVISLAIGPVVAECICTLMFAVLRAGDMFIRPTFSGTKPIFKFGFHLVSIGGAAQIATKLSDLFLGRVLGTAALGVYSRANVLATTLFYGVYGQASAVLFVKMSSEMRDTGCIRDTFIRAIKIITILMWPLAVTIGILSPAVVHLLFGPQYQAAAMPLTILMVWQFIAIGFSMNWELFVLNHETDRQVRFEIARAVVGTLAFAAGSFVSITAAAFGRVADALLGFILYRPHMDRLAGTAHGELERTYLQSAAVTAVTSLPPLVLMISTGWNPQTSIWWITAALAASSVIWLTCLLRIGHPLGSELISMISRFTYRGKKV